MESNQKKQLVSSLEFGRRKAVSSFFTTTRILQENPILSLGHFNAAYKKMQEALADFSFEKYFDDTEKLYDFIHENTMAQAIYLEQYIHNYKDEDVIDVKEPSLDTENFNTMEQVIYLEQYIHNYKDKYVIDVKKTSLDTENFSDEELKSTFRPLVTFYVYATKP